MTIVVTVTGAGAASYQRNDERVAAVRSKRSGEESKCRLLRRGIDKHMLDPGWLVRWFLVPRALIVVPTVPSLRTPGNRGRMSKTGEEKN